MASKPYPKIDTLFSRGENFKVNVGDFCRPEFAAIDKWTVSEKADGKNVRLDYRREADIVSFGYAGRTDNARFSDEEKETLGAITSDNDASRVLNEQLEKYDVTSLTLYGELIGPRIQGNPYRLERREVLLFDVLVNDRTWLAQPDVVEYGKMLYLRTPQYIEGISVTEVVATLQDYSSRRAAVPLDKTVDVDLEGFILRPAVELRDQRGNRVIAKLKVRDF